MPLEQKIAIAVVFCASCTIAVALLIQARRKRAEREQIIRPEDIILDSGTRSVRFRYENYRAPGFSQSGGVRDTTTRIVLTRRAFAILGKPSHHVPLADLGRYAVTNDGAALVIRTDRQKGASGHMELRMPLADAEGWARALRAAGASS